MITTTASLQGFGVRLDPLRNDDLDMVLEWRNHPDVRSRMFTDREITADEHRHWFHLTRRSEAIACFIARWKDEPVAFLSLRSTDGAPLRGADGREPGLYLAPDSALSGTLFALAPVIVLHDASFSERPDGRLLATVKPDNERALRFNNRLGYVETMRTDDVVQMELTRPDHELATAPIRRFLARAEPASQEHSR